MGCGQSKIQPDTYDPNKPAARGKRKSEIKKLTPADAPPIKLFTYIGDDVKELPWE